MTLYRKQSWGLLAVAFATVAVLAACEPGDPGRSTGAYPIDIFQEMHYNQSYKAQEPPRFFPPADSFPVSGGFLAAPAKADAADLISPFDLKDDEFIERGALLFRQNCAVCHGLTGEGPSDTDPSDGFVGNRFPLPPPSFDSPRIKGDGDRPKLTPGELYASVSNGFGLMSMPGPDGAPTGFQSLLGEEDRWALVALIDSATQTRRDALNAVNNFPDADGDGDTEPERTLRLLQLKGVTE